jgi:hypothetical protein
MKSAPIAGTPVWVTVKVSSGIVADARVFTDEKDAMRLHDQWRYEEDFNEDYDEVDVVEARVESCSRDNSKVGQENQNG